VEPVAIMRDWFFLFRFYPLTCLAADTAPIFPVQQGALFLPLIFSGTASG